MADARFWKSVAEAMQSNHRVAPEATRRLADGRVVTVDQLVDMANRAAADLKAADDAVKDLLADLRHTDGYRTGYMAGEREQNMQIAAMINSILHDANSRGQSFAIRQLGLLLRDLCSRQ